MRRAGRLLLVYPAADEFADEGVRGDELFVYVPKSCMAGSTRRSSS